jgi:hypothetical protein
MGLRVRKYWTTPRAAILPAAPVTDSIKAQIGYIEAANEKNKTHSSEKNDHAEPQRGPGQIIPGISIERLHFFLCARDGYPVLEKPKTPTAAFGLRAMALSGAIRIHISAASG